jgi:hypothetical protein
MAKQTANKPAHTDVIKLLTATEQKLFHASLGTPLSKATAADLGKSIALTRALRDKWRDQFRSQRRAGQAAARARGVEGNDRTHLKSELFTEMLGRFEARLAEMGATVNAAVAAKRKASTRPSRPARTAAHRTERAKVRASLAGLADAGPGLKTAGRKAGSARKAKAAPAALPKKKKSARRRPARG